MNGCIATGRRAGYCPPEGPRGPAPPVDRDFREVQALLDEFLVFATAVDGVVVVPDRANDPNQPCRCVDFTKSNGQVEPICFKNGVVGTLTQYQVGTLCRTRLPLRHPEGIERRLTTFQRAAEECSGIPLDQRIECMSRNLKRDGVSWGLGP